MQTPTGPECWMGVNADDCSPTACEKDIHNKHRYCRGEHCPGGDRHNGPSEASDSVGLASVFRPKRRPGLRRVRKGLIIRRLELFSKEPSALMPRSPARRALRLSGIVSMCVTSWVIVRSSGDNAGTKRLQQQSHRRDGANLGTQESDCKLLRITTRILQQS